MIKNTIAIFFISFIIGYFFIFNENYDFKNKFLKIKSEEANSKPYIPLFEEIYNSTFTFAENAQPVSLNSFMKKDTEVVIHFWATWCAPCLDEIPSLYKYAQNQNVLKKPVVFIFIAINDTWEKIQHFLKKTKIDPKLVGYWLIDNNNESYNKFRVDKVPESFIIRSYDINRLVGAQIWK